MVLGVGIDTVEIARIRRAMNRFGDHFLHRLFTETEQNEAQRMTRPERFLASRFAAKEAMSKALGTGMAHGVTWRDIQVAKHPSGQPYISLRGRAEAIFRAMVPQGHHGMIHLSLTDTQDSAQSMVVVSASPDRIL